MSARSELASPAVANRDEQSATRSVLAVLGTDRHRFDRLIDWLERWQQAQPDPPRLVIQHGFSRRPASPESAAFLDHARLQQELASAAVVVSHGGPATILEARRVGRVPIVVPRDPARDEHVDNHQQLFARRLSKDRMILLCESEPELNAALDSGLADLSRLRWQADPAEAALRAEAVARVGRVIEALTDGRGGGLAELRRAWR